MVTKPNPFPNPPFIGYVLAKIHMVTKLILLCEVTTKGYVLAKIHMVTKPGPGRPPAQAVMF